jgi:hypothetical protein
MHLAAPAVLVFGCTVQQISSQGARATQAATQLHARRSPVTRFSAAPAGSASFLLAALPGSAPFGVAPFGMQAETLDRMGSDLAFTMARTADPFLGFEHAGTFAPVLPRTGALDTLGSASAGAARGSRGVLFPLPSIFPLGRVGRANARPGSSLFSVATLDRMMGGDLYLPVNSSVGGLRFDYEDNARPGARMAGFSRGSASAMFASPFLRKGMTLSAGALFGMRSTASPGGFRGMAPGMPKSTVPSWGLRLSF